jgi:hypothetical protein
MCWRCCGCGAADPKKRPKEKGSEISLTDYASLS